MRYTAKQYAAAILAAVKDKTEKKQKEIFGRFLEILLKNGDWKKNVAILREAEKIILSEKGLKKVYAEAPQEISGALKAEIEKTFDRKIHFTQKINPSLLGGIKILVDDEILIDASVKRRIEKLFLNA